MTIASPTATIRLSACVAAAQRAPAIAKCAGRIRTWLRRAFERKELKALSNRQLADAGIDRAMIEPRGAVMEVDGAVMRRLMSMS